MVRYFLGLDAGGSQCRARLVDGGGRILGEGRGGPANTRRGITAVRDTLLETAGEATRAAGLGDADLGDIAMAAGIAGISRDGVEQAITAMDFPYASTAFVSDGMIANLGAHAGGDGAVLVIGTGSVAHVRVGGENSTIGGYGFPISDEASGAALGLSAMRHALRALDGRVPPGALSEAVGARFGHETAAAIAWMDAATPTEYATFAPLVMDLAEADDLTARAIVVEAVQHIERFIETIFDRGAPRCALAGGLAPRMRPWLRARTADRLVEALGDPLDGALFLAGYRPQG